MPDAERAKETLAELRGSLAGDALAPGDAAYDEARGCFNAMIDRRPAVIARCRGAGERWPVPSGAAPGRTHGGFS